MLESINIINNIKIPKIYQTVSENEEYYLIKENILYKIIILKRQNDIKIECDHYDIILNNNDLSLILGIRFKPYDEIYEYYK